MLARIAKAKQYKEDGRAAAGGSSTAPSQVSAPPPRAAAASPRPPLPLPPPPLPPAASLPPPQWPAAQQAQPPSSSSPPSDSAAAAQAGRLAAESPVAAASAPAPLPSSSFAAAAATGLPARAGGPTDTDASAAAAARPVSSSFQQYERDGVPQTADEYTRMLMASPGSARQGAGSATQAADWMQGILADGRPQQAESERMEEFSLAREMAQRAEGANIITGGMVGVRGQAFGEAAAAAAAAESAAEAVAAGSCTPGTASSPPAGDSEEEAVASSRPQAGTEAASSPKGATWAPSAATAAAVGEAYQPSVSTWGVFPRPNDISKAFGGGRNISRGQELETPEQRASRELTFKTAMAQYKKSIGAEVEPEVEAAAAVLVREGMALLAAGDLQAAYNKMDDATKMVPLKTPVGGEATLQKAIALDSSGESKAAERLYRSLLGHPVTAIGKKARQLLFGFQAMSFLKVEGSASLAQKGQFAGYFRRIADRNKVYVASAEDRVTDEASARLATLVALGVLLGPVAAFGLLAWARSGG